MYNNETNICACCQCQECYHVRYLQSKFVEAEVDKVLDAGQDAVIQVLSCDALEDDAEGGGLKVIMETKVELVAMDSRLEHQQSQHQQMVLPHRNKLKVKGQTL